MKLFSALCICVLLLAACEDKPSSDSVAPETVAEATEVAVEAQPEAEEEPYVPIIVRGEGATPIKSITKKSFAQEQPADLRKLPK